MLKRRLGKTGPEVSAIGLGAMGMSTDWYGHADEAEGLATIDAALEAGVTLIDTGDFYGMGHNEMLIGQALKQGSKRDKAVISVKFGGQRGPDGHWLGHANDRNSTRTALAYTLKRLRVDYIDIYRPARVSPTTPIEETVGAIAELVKEGYVRHIGLSEVGVETIRKAHAVHPIVDLQIEYSLISRGPEAEILPVLNKLVLPDSVANEADLRKAAAETGADVLVVYTIDTQFFVPQRVEYGQAVKLPLIWVLPPRMASRIAGALTTWESSTKAVWVPGLAAVKSPQTSTAAPLNFRLTTYWELC